MELLFVARSCSINFSNVSVRTPTGTFCIGRMRMHRVQSLGFALGLLL